MKLAPGPSTFFQMLKMLIKRQMNPMQFYEDVFKEYGDIAYLRMGKNGFLMLNDADAIEQVLQKDAHLYTKSAAYERFRLIFGNGLLVSNGEVWKKQRRLMAFAFSSKNIERLHPLIIAETKRMMLSWENLTRVDLAEEMNSITLQIISKSMLGELKEEETKIIRSSVQEMLTYLQTSRHLWMQFFFAVLPVQDKVSAAIKLETHLPLSSTKKFFNSIAAVDKLVARLIHEARTSGQGGNLIDTLIKATDDETQATMTNQQLRDEVMNILIAGHETTSNALSWTFHQILKYPEVYRKVKEEVLREVSGEVPTFEQLHKLIYTQAVFEESMRLFPPFWRISRRTTVDTKVKDFDIPAGTNVISSIFTVQKSAKYWHNPLEFKPERFIEKKEFHKFAYIPFGAGPRVCIGANLAMTEAITILAAVIKNFDITKDFSQDPTMLLSLTSQPKEGCKVKIKKVGR